MLQNGCTKTWHSVNMFPSERACCLHRQACACAPHKEHHCMLICMMSAGLSITTCMAYNSALHVQVKRAGNDWDCTSHSHSFRQGKPVKKTPLQFSGVILATCTCVLSRYKRCSVKLCSWPAACNFQASLISMSAGVPCRLSGSTSLRLFTRKQACMFHLMPSGVMLAACIAQTLS